MSKLIDSMIQNAAKLHKTIVLPEGEEPRTINAARMITDKGIAKVILLGDINVIKSVVQGIDLEGIEVINPKSADKLDEYTNMLYELRKAKGLIIEDAKKLAQDNLYFGALMTKSGDADGMVAGAINSTGNVLRPGLQVIKTAKGIKTVSSCFLMNFEGTPYTDRNVMIFGDCAVNIDPSAEQLADIAMASAESATNLAGIKEPKVAMLSFSTKGSAKHEMVDKVVEATMLVQERAPHLECDGDLQADAALVPQVGELKAKGSKVAGQANVLIFPDLQAGNIGYKLVQRMAGAEAIGPICQGFAKPINDLSRGCSSDDIVGVVAITVLQTQII